MAFTDVTTIRGITQEDNDTFTTSEIEAFIVLAQKEVISKLQKKIIREPVLYIDETRKNDKSQDTTFYLKNWRGNYLGDTNYDGNVTTSDIIIYQVDNENVETSYSPLAINSDNMSFTLTSVPSNSVDLFTTYTYTPYDFVNPDPLVALATAYLASSYLKLTESGGDGTGGDDSRSIKIGNLSIGAGKSSSSGWTYGKVNSFYDKYMELMAQLIENSTGGAIWGESYVQI